MNSNAWDKFVLLGAAVVVIGLSVLFVMKTQGFGEAFEMVSTTPNNEQPPTDKRRADIAKKFVESSMEWETKVKGAAPKPVPLFVSIPIVESEGRLIDMLDPNAPMLRAPVSNAWLLDNELDFLNSSVLQQDPDSDGFINVAEWEAKTDPQDSASHPPYADKLVMIDRKQQEYKIKFAARPDSERFQIQRIPTAKWPQRDSFYVKVGETSEDGQFRLNSFTEAKEVNNVGIEVDATRLNITYLPKQEEHEVKKNVEYPIPTYYAELKFLLEPDKTFYVKEGETFNLLMDPETKYRVTKVNEDSTIVTYQTGAEPEQTVEIRKK